jgi:hypothetical protein
MPAKNQPKFEFWHVDYFHGNPQSCYEAPFCNRPNRDHFRTPDEAREVYEELMRKYLIPRPVTRADPDPVQVPENDG